MAINTLFNRAFGGIDLSEYPKTRLPRDWISPNVIGLVFNPNTNNKLTDSITKNNMKYAIYRGIPIYVKQNQNDRCLAFYSQELLEIYLNGGLEKIAEEGVNNG